MRAVGVETDPDAQRIAEGTAVVMREVEQASRPGDRVSELEALGCNLIARSGCTADDADSGHPFSHGLRFPLVDMALSDSRPDRVSEEGMVFAAHLQVPGDDRTRNWLEQVVRVRSDDGESLPSWDYGLTK